MWQRARFQREHRQSRPPPRPAATAIAPAASSPAAVPSRDIAPGVPGLTGRSVVTRTVGRPHAFPISLATVSLPAAISAAASTKRAPVAYCVLTIATAAAAATPQ